MHSFARLLGLSVSLVVGCVSDEPMVSGGVPEDPDQEMPEPCADYALGESPEGDGACFTFVGVSCAAETTREACEAVLEIASPNGDLGCAWSASSVVIELGSECTVLDRPERCLAVVFGPGDVCDGSSRWTRLDEAAGQELVVELDCALVPVPDFDECVEETAADACVCG